MAIIFLISLQLHALLKSKEGSSVNFSKASSSLLHYIIQIRAFGGCENIILKSMSNKVAIRTQSLAFGNNLLTAVALFMRRNWELART